MGYINFLGSIASIICLGIIFWRFIKKGKISFFNVYMLIMVLIQIISVGYSLWSHKNVIAIIIGGMILIFTLLFWLVMYLNEKQLDLIKSQMDLIKSQAKTSKSQTKIIKEINQDMKELVEYFDEFIEVIMELMVVESIKVDVKTERLNDKLKEIQKKIGVKK